MSKSDLDSARFGTGTGSGARANINLGRLTGDVADLKDMGRNAARERLLQIILVRDSNLLLSSGSFEFFEY
jgi:hypothetical protein